MYAGSLLYQPSLSVILSRSDEPWGRSRVKGMFYSNISESQELDLFLSLTFQKKELAVLITDCRILLTTWMAESKGERYRGIQNIDENQISSLAAYFCSIALKKEINHQKVYTVYRATKFWSYVLFIKLSVGNM